MERKLKILIADDVTEVVENNKRIVLLNENVEVIGIANDGKEEYDMILDLKPDLVITDNQMPNMNGIEVIEKINNLELDYKPGFIMVTGDANAELLEKCYKLGVVRVINKLSVMNSLLYAIEDFIYQIDNGIIQLN